MALVGTLTSVACDAPKAHQPDPVRVVESHGPSAGDLALADTPTLAIGELGLSDDSAYAFFDVQGGAFLPGGDIVVGVSGTYEVRMFDSNGRHAWTAGGVGDGPGEFRSSRVLRGCTGDTIRVFDAQLDRMSELDSSGNFIRAWRIGAGSRAPNHLMCGAGGQVAFTTWGAIPRDLTEGQHFRSAVSLYRHSPRGRPEVVRENVPGPERTQLIRSMGPRTWGRKPVFAATDSGVWLGDADEFELQFFDWNGSPAGTIRWVGPGLGVTPTDVDALRSRWERWFEATGNELARADFERRRWPQMRAALPPRFPSISRALALRSGAIWIELFPRPGQSREWHVFDLDGSWLHRVSVPGHVEILDIDADAVLAKVWGADGVERLEVRTLRPG